MDQMPWMSAGADIIGTDNPKATARVRVVGEQGVGINTLVIAQGADNGLCIVGTDQPKTILEKVEVKNKIDEENDNLLKKHPPNKSKINKELRSNCPSVQRCSAWPNPF
jgi:hypothetical protein